MGLFGQMRTAALAAVVVCAVFLSSMGGVRAEAQQQVRIAGAIGGGARVTVGGSVSPQVAGAVDLGAVDGERVLPLMSLRFSMTVEQQTALDALVAAQQNPGSAEYRKWMTPEQFGERFGLASGDLAKVTAWLGAQGFTVTKVARGGLFVQFSGTVEQVSRAFGAKIERINVQGVEHVAAVTEASLPRELAAVTAGVTGLDDFRPSGHGVERMVAGEGEAGVFKPEYTSAAAHYLAPADFYVIYDEGTTLQGGTTGSGVTIAVTGQTDIYAADVAAFQKSAGLPNRAAAVTLYGSDPGYTTNADLVESELAIEWAGAVAPGAGIVYLNSIDAINGSLLLAIDNNVAPVIVNSYGVCESSLGATHLVYYNNTLQQAAAQGISVVVASGEYGATDCDRTGASASNGLVVDFPASSPYVTAVGGTEFHEAGGTYWSSANGSGGGSALSYIPEVVWNDDSAAGLAASGGGASQYFSKPTWQVGTGVPADAARDVPDVSMNGSAVHDGYLVCTQGYCTNGFANATGALDVVGGTATSAATFAGLAALLVQKNGRIGVLNNEIYALANSPVGSSVFHDVTMGTNASPCTAGTLNCAGGGLTGYGATTGYDQATGWGSLEARNLVSYFGTVTPLVSASGTSATYTNVAGSASAVGAGTAVNLTATVTSGDPANTATPTGNVQFTVDNVAVGAAMSLSAGTLSYALNTSGLSTGMHTVQATYLGGGSFSGSRGAFVLNITSSTAPDFTLTPATATVTTPAGTVAPGIVFTVKAVNGFTGNINFTAGAFTSLAVPVSFSLNPLVLSQSVTSASTTLSLFAYTLKAEAKPTAPGGKAAGYGVVLAGIVLLMLPRRRRMSGLAVAVMAFAMVGLSGCAGGSAAPVSTTPIIPTAAGTYTVVVAANAVVNGVAVTHSSVVTLVVQ